MLAKNQLLAERNRGWFAGREVLALNLMSSPGAGKTTLLERTIRDLQRRRCRSSRAGRRPGHLRGRASASAPPAAPVVQINTGTGCHLDADMVARGVERLAPPRGRC